jgi:hypothetical protein
MTFLSTRRSARRVARRKILCAVVICAGILALLGSWTLASPVGSSPDDTFHLPSIWCSAGSHPGQCDVSNDGQRATVPGLVLGASWCYAPLSEVSASCQKSIEKEYPSVVTSDWNGQFADYPPVFYRVMHTFVTDNVVASALAMRLFNAFLACLLFLAVYVLAPRSIRQSVFVTAIVGSVPLGLFLVASNNPSSWSILGLSTYWAFLLLALESQQRRIVYCSYVLAGLTALMAAGARADAAVYIAISTIAVVFLTLRGPGAEWRTVFRPRLIPIAVVLIIAMVAFLRSAQSGIATGGFGGSTMATDMGAHGTLERISSLVTSIDGSAVVAYVFYLPEFIAGSFGGWGLGWLDTPMPPIVVWTMFPIMIALIFVGLGSMYRAKWLAMGLVALLVVALPTWIAVSGGDAPGTNLQPRYIYPLVLVLVGLALVRKWRTSSISLSSPQWWFLAAAASIAHSVALHANMRRYLTGNDVSKFNLDANYEWWWSNAPSPMTIWVVGTLAFALLATLALASFSTVPNSESPDPSLAPR